MWVWGCLAFLPLVGCANGGMDGIRVAQSAAATDLLCALRRVLSPRGLSFPIYTFAVDEI